MMLTPINNIIPVQLQHLLFLKGLEILVLRFLHTVEDYVCQN